MVRFEWSVETLSLRQRFPRYDCICFFIAADEDVVANEIIPFTEFERRSDDDSYFHYCRCGGVFEVGDVALLQEIDRSKWGRSEAGPCGMFRVFLHLQDRLFFVSFPCLLMWPVYYHNILDERVISFWSCLFDFLLGKWGAGKEVTVLSALSFGKPRLSGHAKPGGSDCPTDHKTFPTVEGTMSVSFYYEDSSFPTRMYRRMYGNGAVTVPV